MFSFAKNFVKTLEQSAETIIATSSNLINTEADPYFQPANTSFGFRVLHVEKGSTADSIGLEPWFDYIVGINNHELLSAGSSNTAVAAAAIAGGSGAGNSNSKNNVPDYNLFIQEIHNCINRPVTLNVWNAKGGILRDVHVLNVEPFENPDNVVYNNDGYLVDPHTKTVTNNKFQTLGFSMQATPLITATYVYHVLEIQPNSPAEHCGLLPHADYIIGANDGLFATGGEDLFSRVITSIYNRNPNDSKIQLYVYNHDFDVVRPVTIFPHTSWGGNGILGCGVGYGYLHRLPQVVGKFENAIGGIGNDPNALYANNGNDNSSHLSNIQSPNSSNHYLQAPGQTLFNYPNASTEFIPAQLSSQAGGADVDPATSAANTGEGALTSASASESHRGSLVSADSLTAPPPVSSRRKKKHPTVTQGDFADYFAEETAKSEKLDVRTKTKPAAEKEGSLPPPPVKH